MIRYRQPINTHPITIGGMHPLIMCAAVAVIGTILMVLPRLLKPTFIVAAVIPLLWQLSRQRTIGITPRGRRKMRRPSGAYIEAAPAKFTMVSREDAIAIKKRILEGQESNKKILISNSLKISSVAAALNATKATISSADVATPD